MVFNSMNKIGKFMRILLLYDLPSVTNADKKIYRNFVKYLTTEGFIRIQESVFVKACLNANAVKTCKTRIRKRKYTIICFNRRKLSKGREHQR